MKRNSKSTDIFKAAHRGDSKTIEAYLAEGGDVNIADDKGFTVFHYAVAHGYLALSAMLVHAGARVNGLNPEGYSPLMASSKLSNTESVQFLIDHGADVNAVMNTGETALMMGASASITTDVVKILLSAGAGIDAQSGRGTTALMRASKSGKLDNIRVLVEHGADLGVKDMEGRTATDWADTAEIASYLKSITHVIL